MGENFAIVTAMALYKVVCLLTGVALSYFGYRLFLAGVWGNAGDLDVTFSDNKLVLKSAAPGTFFALFGTIIIVFTVWKGLEVNLGDEDPPSKRATTAAPKAPDPNAVLKAPKSNTLSIERAK
jgi:hypothetical protein